VPLITAYGAKGAALAMVAAELTLALCYEWSLSFERPELRLASGFALRAATAMIFAGAVPLYLDLSSLASAVVGSALYIAALLAFGIVPAEIRHALMTRWRARTTHE
jgi:hypothetical protein